MGKNIFKHFIYLQCQTEEKECEGHLDFLISLKKNIVFSLIIQYSSFNSLQCVFVHLTAFIKQSHFLFLFSERVKMCEKESSRNTLNNAAIILTKLLCAQTPVY